MHFSDNRINQNKILCEKANLFEDAITLKAMYIYRIRSVYVHPQRQGDCLIYVHLK